MPSARHDLRGAVEGEAAPHRVRGRSGNASEVRQGHQGTRRLHGRHAAHDRTRHVHRERDRARDRQPDAPLAGRLLRPRQGQDPLVGQAVVRRPRDPVSRLVARLRVRREGHHARPHRSPPQVAGDDFAVRARSHRRRNSRPVLPHRHVQAGEGRLDDAVRRRAHAQPEAGPRSEERQDRRTW